MFNMRRCFNDDAFAYLKTDMHGSLVEYVFIEIVKYILNSPYNFYALGFTRAI